MTATDRLRAMLDERGVEWEALPDQQEGDFTITATRWHDGEGGLLTMFISEPHGSTWDFFWLPTPEQAIAATLGAGTIDKAAERIEVLSGFAREYLHRYGYLMSAAGEGVTDEVLAIEQVINEVCGRKVASE